MTRVSARKLLGLAGAAGMAALVAVAAAATFTIATTGSVPVHAQSVRPPAGAVVNATPSGSSVRPPTEAVTNAPPTHAAPGFFPAADMWRAVRDGTVGRVTIPDTKAATLIQSEGENFRIVRNGAVSVWGAWLLLAMVVLLVLFFLIRGTVKIESGRSGQTVERFNGLERFAHWLTATAFLVLALTGLNMMYGRYGLKPLIGHEAFAELTQWGKYVHNYMSFAFMAGVILEFIIWVRHNFPTWTDVKWLVRAGGLLTKHSHPPAGKFNAGQKLMFWFVVIFGTSISISGIGLLFPFEIHPFAPTFKVINAVFQTHLPTVLTPLQETQLSLLWHGTVAQILMAVIIGHIYIGTPVGMEGAFGAMGTGQVDVNWAREHHSLWLKEVEARSQEPPAAPPAAVPAE
jgi:formate dehydrogenase subunit gamma